MDFSLRLTNQEIELQQSKEISSIQDPLSESISNDETVLNEIWSEVEEERDINNDLNVSNKQAQETEAQHTSNNIPSDHPEINRQLTEDEIF